jgi:hypothetical protein
VEQNQATGMQRIADQAGSNPPPPAAQAEEPKQISWQVPKPKKAGIRI